MPGMRGNEEIWNEWLATKQACLALPMQQKGQPLLQGLPLSGFYEAHFSSAEDRRGTTRQ
jgi:hypothetical protein